MQWKQLYIQHRYTLFTSLCSILIIVAALNWPSAFAVTLDANSEQKLFFSCMLMYMYNAVSRHYSKHDRFHALLSSGFALLSQRSGSETLLTLLAIACRHICIKQQKRADWPLQHWLNLSHPQQLITLMLIVCNLACLWNKKRRVFILFLCLRYKDTHLSLRKPHLFSVAPSLIPLILLGILLFCSESLWNIWILLL